MIEACKFGQYSGAPCFAKAKGAGYNVVVIFYLSAAEKVFGCQGLVPISPSCSWKKVVLKLSHLRAMSAKMLDTLSVHLPVNGNSHNIPPKAFMFLTTE
jgi:hypothetical protein